MSRTLLVSHRLPYSVVVKDNSFTLEASVGGLATGLMPLLKDKSLWLGWSGASQKLSKDMNEDIRAEFEAHGCIPIDFPKKAHNAFLTEMCNGVLWPLYHYQVGNLPLQFTGWDQYAQVNQIVADAIANVAKAGDLIWIHDYHFQLVPQMLREMNLDVKIGFFLHIPFPAYELYRILPWRKEILKGLLGADLIGFHTTEYVDHFIASAKQLLNYDAFDSSISLFDRQVQISAYPLGVDPEELSKPFDGPSPLADALHKVRAEHPELKLMLSVDRLDYTKGLARKLLAFEHLLEHNPELREKLMLIQIAPVSREDVPAYHHFRRQLDEHVGRINGKFATPAYQPIFYLTRSFAPHEIYQIYRDVDVMLVTPVRDGMNLVAKEFVASRLDGDGVLVLSEFAGAATELHEALMINPYDIRQMATSFKTAVEMPKAEREARMASLRDRVLPFRTADWSHTFLSQLRSTPSSIHRQHFESPKALAAEIAQKQRPIKVTLDYDGTLFPIVRVPATAIPDQELRKILSELSRLCDLHIVSGRPMHELKSWFAGIKVHLHAEHGAVSEGREDRVTAAEVHAMTELSSAMCKIAAQYPGTRVEKKMFSCCFHYRNANQHDSQKSCAELREAIARDFPSLQVLEGKKTVEARFPHLHKGMVVKDLLKSNHDERSETCLVAIGDDRTDEDMFLEVPADGFSVVVGGHSSHARYRLRDSEDVRVLLNELGLLLNNGKMSKDHPLPLRKHPPKWNCGRSADFLSI